MIGTADSARKHHLSVKFCKHDENSSLSYFIYQIGALCGFLMDLVLRFVLWFMVTYIILELKRGESVPSVRVLWVLLICGVKGSL